MRTLCLLLLAFAVTATCAQDFPRRPVRFVVPFPPGGANDAVGRTLTQRLTEIWPHPTVVDNRGGGGTVIGTEIVARSPADGHTLLLTSNAHAIMPALHRKLPYDVMKDFAYVTQVGYGPFLLVVHPALAADTVKSLVSLAKAKPGQITYGSSGIASGGHLAMELFKSMAGIDMVHVPYKGGGPLITDLLAGQIQLTFATQAVGGSHVKAGKLRGLAVSSAKRTRMLPELPTLAEACCPGYEAAAFWGVAVPAATPKPLVERLNGAIAGVLRQPEIVERYAAQSVEITSNTPAEETARMHAELARWARAVKASGAKID